MNDLDQHIRDRLRDDADAFLRLRGPATMPATVTRRLRRRRVVALTMALGLVAGTSAGAVVLWGAIAERSTSDRPGSAPGAMRPVIELDRAPTVGDPERQWRGLWPEVTETAARIAQQDATGAGSDLAWRLSAEKTAVAYARDVFDWEDPIFVGGDLDPGDAQRLPVQCQECGGSPSVEVTVERLQDLGGSAIWSVTGLRVENTEQGHYLARTAVEDLIRRRAKVLTSLFMHRRIDGSMLAEQYLAPEAAAAYHEHAGGLYLYGASVDEARGGGRSDAHPTLDYGGFDIVSGPWLMVDGTFHAMVSIDVRNAPSGAITGSVEILRIAPRDGRLLIVSAQRR